MSKPCKDCPVGSKRPAPHPGPRCATHHREVRAARRLVAHGKRVEGVYGITSDEYWALYEAQGGRCYICRKASGRARRLAVDHDHETGMVRGLVCGPDNLMLGRLGVDGLVRALEYLHAPPAVAIIGRRTVPLTPT